MTISNKKRILVVDDESELTLLFSMALDGFVVDSFNDPLLALSNFKEGYYDLVILDIIMPKMSGFVLHNEITKIDDKVKVCFLTANEFSYYEEFRKEELCALDKNLFIAKPIQVDQFIKEINRIMNSR
jgi:DNA-binding NtrC family response regulator